MKKILLTFAVFVMAICASAQKNQYFWYQGNLMLGNPIAQIDSVTFGEGEPTDTLHIMLPRTIIKTIEVHDTIYITIHDTVCPNNIPEGALNGLFSVTPDKKVRFSKGNLQYQASTDTWRFAENQYDTIGALNANISDSYNGWIDLFGWGTGNNPTLSTQDNADYSTFVDWGVNAISNGGNEANLWRTLTNDEWVYLFESRENASTKYGMATVAGVNGIIVLPDIYEGTTINADHSAWENNTISASDWAVCEDNGAVFLPAVGYRNGTGVNFVGLDGSYRSSTPNDVNYAYYLGFLSNYLSSLDDSNRFSGLSVRLVR